MIKRLVDRVRSRRSRPSGGEGPLAVSVREAMVDVQAYARSHGGSIDLVSVDEDGKVRVRFRGACAGCPMSGVTLKLGIEQRLRSLAPGVREVVAV